MSPNSDWNINKDLEYYEKIPKEKMNGMFFIYLNSALRHQKYYELFDSIDLVIAHLNKWAILQEINVNASEFSIYLINLSDSNSHIISTKFSYEEGVKIDKRMRVDEATKDELNHLIFKKIPNGYMNISNVNIEDTTVYYITAFDGLTIYRMAMYHLDKNKSNYDLFKVIHLIKDTPLY